MKREIRRGVFETNSSSTHSLTLCSRDDYDKWKNGELLYDIYSEKLITFEKLYDDIEHAYIVNGVNVATTLEQFKDYLKTLSDSELYNEFEVLTYDYYYEHYCEYYECFSDSYVTKSNEEVVAFGMYGFDC